MQWIAMWFQHGYHHFAQIPHLFRKLAQTIVPEEWTVIHSKDIKGLPRQQDDSACGIFMLMYALYIVLGGDFDFTNDDMATIRTWWCLLLLSGHSVVWLAQKRTAEDPTITVDLQEAKRPRTIPLEESETVNLLHQRGILEMPRICLEEILLEVVLHDCYAALLTLALVCSCFRDIVSNKWFRERAHFLWLDSVATWSKFSSMYKQEFYTMYSVQNCIQCNCTFKSCMPGYVGRGKLGELRGIYSDDPHPGFCSQFCQLQSGCFE